MNNTSHLKEGMRLHWQSFLNNNSKNLTRQYISGAAKQLSKAKKAEYANGVSINICLTSALASDRKMG
jgi:hypothetical protein